MKNFYLEEAVLDDIAKDLDSLEVPLSERAFKLVVVLAVLIIAPAVFRTFSLNVFNGEFYKKRALLNTAKIVSLPSERGIVFDRFGKALVENEEVFRLSLRLPELFKEKREETFKAVGEILGISASELEKFIEEVDLEKQDSATLPMDLNKEQAKKLETLNLKSLFVKKDFKREYFEPEVFSHVIGYMGLPISEEIGEKISFNNKIGKIGLERYYDGDLRGEEGQIVYYRNAKGEIIGDKFLSDSRKGYNIETTIDADFQIYFYNQLKKRLKELNSKSGVGVALNPQNGEVLALVSLPSFNNNKITSDSLSDSDRPFFNRAISGLYVPGSTIKPLVAFAALKEGVIDDKTEIFSRGYIEIPNPYFPESPSRFLDWKKHGWVNLASALARSSNVFFYSIGGGLPQSELGIIKGADKNNFTGLGIEKMKNYWKTFGLNKKTGIDLPFEALGFLPDPLEKEARLNEKWRLGDTYNVSIGQGNLLITPLRLIDLIAGFSEGKFYRPFITKKIKNDSGEIISETSPEISMDYSGNLDYFKEIQKGMIDVVSKPYGTANYLSDLPAKVAGKTGTTQVKEKTRINSFFAGYMPVENPQIAVLVLIENVEEKTLNALPVAKEVLKWYYENRLKNEQ